MKAITEPDDCPEDKKHMYKFGFLKPAFCGTPEQAAVQLNAIENTFDFWLSQQTHLSFKYKKSNTKEIINGCYSAFKYFKANKSSIVLFGPPGTGKTCAALMCVKFLLDQQLYHGFEIRFVDMYMFDEKCKGLFDDDLRTKALTFFEAIKKVPVLIFDDLGAEPKNETNLTRITGVLGDRYGDELLTIVTTNLTLEEYVLRYPERLVSRTPPKNRWFLCSGSDRRAQDFS